MNTIVAEFGGTAPHSLSEYYRGGGLVPNTPVNSAIPTSGQIAMGNFYGSANRATIPLTITSNTYNYDVFTNRGPTYIAGASDITVTVNPGVIVGSTSTGAFAMLVPSSFSPGDTVRIVNNGTIQGMGGAGGSGASTPAPPGQFGAFPGGGGGSGGSALYVNRPTTVTNNGVIAGGGGGGGGGGGIVYSIPKQSWSVSGGGGGGGAGFNGGNAGSGGSASGSTPGNNIPGGPGGAGTSPAGGGGGGGGPSPAGGYPGGPGGTGGGRGASGSSGSGASNPPVSLFASGGGGGGAGNYIVGNPFVTWPATGTRQGGVA